MKVESGSGIKAYALEHVDGENNPDNTSLTDDQESYTLTLGFRDKESFVLHLTVGIVNQTFRQFMLAGITNRLWEQKETATVPPTPQPPSSCSGAPKRYPISCGVPSAKEHSEPNSTSAVLYNEMGRWTCKSGYSVDGTPSGATFYEAECGSSGLFLPFGQDCRDIDYCDGVPCGANGELQYQCVRTWHFFPAKVVYRGRQAVRGN